MGATPTGSAGVSRRSRSMRSRTPSCCQPLSATTVLPPASINFLTRTLLHLSASLQASRTSVSRLTPAPTSTLPTQRTGALRRQSSPSKRHQGFFQGPVMMSNDWTGPYDTPLGLDMVYTLAAQLITSCPSSNAMLPVNASKPLLNGGSPIFAAAGGATISLTYDGAGANQSLAVYNGLGSTMVAIHNGNVTLPQGFQGYSYLIVTTAADLASVNTSNTVAGPAEVQSGFDAFQSNPGFMNPYGA